jgi:hypothetical protein
MKKDCSAVVVLSISELIQSAEVSQRMTQFEGGQVSRHWAPLGAFPGALLARVSKSFALVAKRFVRPTKIDRPDHAASAPYGVVFL